MQSFYILENYYADNYHADRGPRSLCLRMLVGLTLNYIIIEGAVKLS